MIRLQILVKKLRLRILTVKKMRLHRSKWRSLILIASILASKNVSQDATLIIRFFGGMTILTEDKTCQIFRLTKGYTNEFFFIKLRAYNKES